MKAILTSDWHFGLYTHSAVSRGEDIRFKELSKSAEYIVDYAIAMQVDVFVHCGDIFHTSRPSVRDIECVMFLFKRLVDNGIQCYIIDGNHDAPASAESVTPIALLGKIESSTARVNILEASESISKKVDFGDTPVVFIPYGVPLADWKRHGADKKCVVIGHTTMTGAVSGYESNLLSRYCEVEPIPDVAVTICGHIHKHQVVRDYPNFAAYCGSIVRNDFGERGEKKGFLFFNDWDVKFVEIPGIYDLVQIRYDEPFPDVVGKIVKVVGKSDISVNVDLIQKNLYEAGAISVVVDIQHRVEVAIRSASMTTDQSVMNLWETYCDVKSQDQSIREVGRVLIGRAL